MTRFAGALALVPFVLLGLAEGGFAADNPPVRPSANALQGFLCALGNFLHRITGVDDVIELQTRAENPL